MHKCLVKEAVYPALEKKVHPSLPYENPITQKEKTCDMKNVSGMKKA